MVQTQMPSTMIAVGHPARKYFRCALLLSLATATVFTLVALATTQNQSVRAHSPWQDDPYDALVSFTMLFTPLLAATSLPRVLLCRADQALPAARFLGLLRSTDVVVATVLVTALLDWIAVVTGFHAAVWGTPGRVLTAALGAVSLTALGAAGATARVHAAARDVGPRDATNPDWCDDLLELASFGTRRLGPLEPSTARLLGLVLAFRDNLGWLIPRAMLQQPLAQLFLLMAVIAAASGICAFSVSSVVDRFQSR